MKKIAVLTDFSERSFNATAYALSLAVHIHADIILYNNFLVPSAAPTTAQVVWPMEDYLDIKANSEDGLNKTSDRLKAMLAEFTAPAFMPNIECRAREGGFSLINDECMADRDIVFLVMGNHQRGFSALMMGNHTREVVDNAGIPVLIVPESASFKHFKKIAFSTDFDHRDLDVLQSLAGLTNYFGAEILLAHICSATAENEALVKDFLNDVSNKINYSRIYYRQLTQDNIRKGLRHVAEFFQVELMVMVHRDKNFLTRLFGGSLSQQMASETELPLLIFPCPARYLPAF